MIVSVSLPWPSADLSPNARHGHWAARHRAVAKARDEARWATRAAKPGPVPADGLLRIRTLWTPPDNRSRDRDGLASRLKAALDGIADALRVDDARFVLWPVEIGPPQRPGGVVVTVEAMP